MNPQLLAVKVRLFEAASLAALETAVNDFLRGQGTPVAQQNWRLVSIDVRYATGATDPHEALVTYTGD